MKKVLPALLSLLLCINLLAQNVGIGTTTPSTKLQIKTPNNTDGFSHLSDGGILLKERVGGASAGIGTYSNHNFRLVANSADVISITPEGNVGIGTTTPGDFKLKVSDVTHGIAIENAFTFDNWELYTVGGNAGSLSFFFNGVLKGTINNSSGIYSAISDERLKTNIQPMRTMLEKIKQLKPATYQFKTTKDQQQYSGFIAQEVMKIFPNLVTHNVIPERKLDVYTMDYSGFGVIAVKGIQELQLIIEDDKKKITTLEERITKLEAALAAIIAK
jgi:hypothetical protein